MVAVSHVNPMALYNYHSTWKHNTDDSTLHGHRCENPKFHFWTRLHKTGAWKKKWRNYLPGKNETKLPPLS